MGLTENQLWDLIEKANWISDHDYSRISKFYQSILSTDEFSQLENFVHLKENELHKKYEKYWLDDPGIDASDDGWSDLKFEVIGRGEKFYKSISVDKLIEMADNYDYEESFSYCFI